MSIRIIVCGGRDFQDRRFVFKALDLLHTKRTVAEVITGDSPTGAERLARDWALNCGVKLTQCPLNRARHGLRAEYVRNAYMITLDPRGVVAFPGGGETAEICQQARVARVPIWYPAGRPS